MISVPLLVLLLVGIRDFLLIGSSEDLPLFEGPLHRGRQRANSLSCVRNLIRESV